MITKVCNKGKIHCNQEKDISEFEFRKDSNKYRNQCKKCRCKQNIEYYNKPKNKEKILKYHRECYLIPEINKKIKDNKIKYRLRPEVKEKEKKMNSIYYSKLEIKEKVKVYNKKYNSDINNKIKINKHRAEKRKIDSLYNFINSMRQRVGKFLRGKRKTNHTKELLGYTFEEFKQFIIENNRIQKGYIFNDYIKSINKGKLTLDHILPLDFFPKTEEGFRLANQLINLRLITINENSKKKNKIDWELIKKYNLEDLYNNIRG